VERDDRQSDLWGCLAEIYVDEYAFGFQADATSLERALTAARHAIEIDRSNQFALVALAQVHFFRQDLAAFFPAAERAMTLNPLNSDALGILGLQIVHTGEFEQGTAIVRRAMELNANHAGWMHFAPLWDHFHKGEYAQALECANRVDVPGFFWPYLVMASACGHLGRRVEAAAAVRDLLALDPEFAAHARSNIGSWHFTSGLMDPILEGLCKAGLAIPATDGSPDTPKPNGTIAGKTERAKSGTDAGAVRTDSGRCFASSRKNSRTPRVVSVAARVRFHDRVAPNVVSRLSTSATGSGFSASRSSRRCIFAMSLVRKHRLASPSPCAASTARMRSAAAPSPDGAISSSVVLSSVNSTRSAPSPLFRQAGARANNVS